MSDLSSSHRSNSGGGREVEIVSFIRELLIIRLSGRGISGSRPGCGPRFGRMYAFDFRMPHCRDLPAGSHQEGRSHHRSDLSHCEDETYLAVEMMKRGALDYLLKPVDLAKLSLAVTRALEHRRLVLENEAYHLHLERLVAEKTQALNDALYSLTHVHSATLDALSMALDFRDQSTSGHSRRVATYEEPPPHLNRRQPSSAD
jgi:hypothetical protein